MDVLKLMVCLLTCVTSGAGQSINVSTADQHLLVEAGSPNVTFNADVLAGTEVPVYNDLQFQMGGVGIARPSFKPTGPVLVVNTAFQDHFEVLETTPPLASVKINNPDMKAHTQVYSWILLTGSTQDVTLIVSDPPVLVLPNEISAGEETQFLCSVRFGLLPGEADASSKIGIHALIGSGSLLDDMGQVVNDYSERGVVTSTYTYNYTFQEQDNGKTLHCEARLRPYPGHKLMTAQQLNVLYLPSYISFGDVPQENKYSVGQQINCSAGGNPGPEGYQWTDLANSQPQVQGQTLDLTEAMAQGGQFWKCEATYGSGYKINANISFTVARGLSITIAKEDQYLLVETGSMGITFNADIETKAGIARYNDIQFIMGLENIARPSNNPTGPVMTINTAYRTHFEVPETTAPRVSVKLNKPIITSHTQVFKWAMLSNSVEPKEVPLIVSDPPVLTLPNKFHLNEVTQVNCSVRFGLLPYTPDAIDKIQVDAFIGNDSLLDEQIQIANDLSEAGVVTRTFVYERTFQVHDNGKIFICAASLKANPGRKLVAAQLLNIFPPSITIADEDRHLLAEAGSPEITFNADIVPKADIDLQNDIQFIMGVENIARPSNNPTGPVMVVNTAYESHFEVLATTAPRVSVKLTKPNVTSHTQVFKWAMLSSSVEPKDVPLIVSDPPVLELPNLINDDEVTQVNCSVRFGLLPYTPDAIDKIQIYAFIGNGELLDNQGEIVNDESEPGVVTRIYTYIHKFHAEQNGTMFNCEARLSAHQGRKLVTSQPLNIARDFSSGGASDASTMAIVASVVAVVLALVAE